MIEIVLFDVFGTLIEYQPDRRELGAPATHDVARGCGVDMSYDEFVAAWDAASRSLEEHTAASCEEFSMIDAARAFAAAAGVTLADAQCADLASTFMIEWRRHLSPVPGVADMLGRLSEVYRLGIVSNTHDPNMVHELVDAMGRTDAFEVVVLSVGHGWRKPHPSIYQAALDRLGCATADGVAFVGDSFEADYAGPSAAGMTPFLIDPSSRHEVPCEQRLASVLDVEVRLDQMRSK